MPRLSRRNRGKSVAVLNAPLTYEQQRMFWRISLSDDIVRALAADYIRGYQDECNADAFKEYEHRFGKHGSSAAAAAAKLARSRKSRHR